ncbi:hypothetical protein BFS35_002950 [Macrococcoides goetzii]|uniref:Uncharacterized protein n=1 Tax=Macrococcoides goetzii TaxID=1891097 RepID=A0A2G5NTV9_9STAP|nr:hypothetical protein [Macrococcus goetzii]RAI82660.1 hypothetical protein BFS35_002950 [Macrococcus goetzii]
MRNLKFEFDFFFISEAFLNQHQHYLINTLVVPKEEFKKNSSLSNVVNNSMYQTWHLTYEFVIVAEPGWYESIESTLKDALKKEMIDNGTQLINDDRLITSAYWDMLSRNEQISFIQQFNDEPSKTDITLFSSISHLTALHNKFPENHGANCLSATLYALTKNPCILEQWVHQETFMPFLNRLGYKEVESSFSSGDIICFYYDDLLTHACYAIDDEYVFNKQGQTFWKPWTIERFETIQNNRSENKIRFFSK